MTPTADNRLRVLVVRLSGSESACQPVDLQFEAAPTRPNHWGYVVCMIIVSGWLRVDEPQRQEYLDACLPVIEAARRAPGCLDFSLAADPLERDRINIFEQWTDAGSVEHFRSSGPSDEQQAVIIEARVHQHDIASTVSLT